MARVQLTDSWSIDLDDSFAARLVDNDLQFVSEGPPPRSVWLAIWSPPEELTTEEVVEMIRGDLHPAPVAAFDERGPDDRPRLASWYPETVEGRTHWGLYGYSLGNGAFVQSAFLAPDETHLPWALAAWRSVHDDA